MAGKDALGPHGLLFWGLDDWEFDIFFQARGGNGGFVF